jgi:hypothetical protein
LPMQIGCVFLTQAAALGFVRSPLWGWEVRFSILKPVHQFKTLTKQDSA